VGSLVKRFLFAFFVLLLAAVVFGLDGPTISSSTHPDSGLWYKETRPAFEWEVLDGATAHSYALGMEAETAPDEISEGIGNSFRAPPKIDGLWFFHVRSKVGGQWTDASHYSLKIDHTAPMSPQNVEATPTDDGNIRVSWDAAFDESSGVDHYVLFRAFQKDFDIRDPATVVLSDNIVGTSFVEEELVEGRTYHYRVRAVDKADNLGGISKSVFTKPKSFCDLEISFTPSLEQETLSISVESQGGELYHANFFVTVPGKEREMIAENITYASLIAREVDLLGVEDGNILFELEAEDNDVDDCSIQFTYFLDRVGPSGGWLSPPENLKLLDVVELKVEAVDSGINPSGIKSVEFLYREDVDASIGFAERVSEREFSLDWNTLSAPNGRYAVIARILDFGGNNVELSRSVSVENTALLLSEISGLLSQAGEEKSKAEKLKGTLIAAGLQDAEFFSILGQADGNYAKASDLLERQVFLETALVHALNAKELFEQAAESVSVERYNNLYVVFEPNSEAEAFREAGLKEELVGEAASNLQELSVSRRIEVNKISDSNGVFYVAVILISFRDVNESTPVQIVEVIPKTVAANASDIISSTDFEVFNADPVIKFDADVMETNYISYALAKRFSKEEADAFAESNPNKEFLVPPIVLGSSASVNSGIIVERFDTEKLFGGVSSFFSSQDAWVFVLAGVLVVLFLFLVIVVLAVSIIIFILVKRRR